MNEGMLLLKLLSLQSCLPRISIFCWDALYSYWVSVIVTGEEIFDMNVLLQIFSHITGEAPNAEDWALFHGLCWECDNWSKKVNLSRLVIYLYLFGSGSCIWQKRLLNVKRAWFSELFYFIWETKKGGLWKCGYQVNHANRATKLLRA